MYSKYIRFIILLKTKNKIYFITYITNARILRFVFLIILLFFTLKNAIYLNHFYFFMILKVSKIEHYLFLYSVRHSVVTLRVLCTP